MSVNIVGIAAFAVICTVILLLLKSYRPEYSLIISVAAGIVILLAIMLIAAPLIEEIRAISESSQISSEYFSIVIKALGICYITQFSADTCRDFGQTALSGKVELAGRVTILLMSLPLVKNIIAIITGLIK